jgi:hypothetical protein
MGEAKINITLLARNGERAAIVAADLKDYAARHGVEVDSITFDPPLTPAENDAGLREVARRVTEEAGFSKAAMPQNTMQRREGESEEEFSARAAAVQSGRREERLDATDATASAPTFKFLGVFDATE